MQVSSGTVATSLGCKQKFGVVHFCNTTIGDTENQSSYVFRLHKFGNLKMLLSVEHMKHSKAVNADLRSHINGCQEMIEAVSRIEGMSHVPCCPICSQELRLLPICQYTCDNGHCWSVCANTMFPILDGLVRKCSQCDVSVAGYHVPEYLHPLLQDSCAYCEGRLEVNSHVFIE